jgi:hypothetical protein
LPWSSRFDEPIELRRGWKLVTPKDAGAYLTNLAKAEHDAPDYGRQWKR